MLGPNPKDIAHTIYANINYRNSIRNIIPTYTMDLYFGTFIFYIYNYEEIDDRRVTI